MTALSIAEAERRAAANPQVSRARRRGIGAEGDLASVTWLTGAGRRKCEADPEISRCAGVSRAAGVSRRAAAPAPAGVSRASERLRRACRAGPGCPAGPRSSAGPRTWRLVTGRGSRRGRRG